MPIDTIADIRNITEAVRARLSIIKEADPQRHWEYRCYFESIERIAHVECWPRLWQRENGEIDIPDDLSAGLIPETTMALRGLVDTLNNDPYLEGVKKI